MVTPTSSRLAALALLVAAGAASVPARAQSLPPPFDEPATRNFSASAARTSDLLVTLAVVTPLVLDAGQGFDRAAGERALVYGEALAVSLAVNAVTKRLVGRPRPYTYNPDPRVEAYARREGRDARLSFYSGHAATAFAAAVAGGYLYATTSADTTARTAVWSAGLAMAGATAALRVRAGKHFPSDVLVGALLGAGAGWALPALNHLDGGAPRLATSEWIAIGAAPLAGALLAALLPMPSDIVEPLGGAPQAHARAQTQAPSLVVPWLSGHGGGLAFARVF